VLKDTKNNSNVFNYDNLQDYKIREFAPVGSDERQYCSQGINLPVGCLTRTPYGEFDEYHTSADNLKFISKEHLFDSYKFLKKCIFYLENNKICRNLYTMCELNLGKRGLYTQVGGVAGLKGNEFNPLIFKWILNYSDGKTDLLTISDKSNLDFLDIVNAYKMLLEKKLINVVGDKTNATN
jgi:aminopeptidase-like protein